MNTAESTSCEISSRELERIIKEKLKEETGRNVKRVTFNCGTSSTGFMYQENTVTGYLNSVFIEFESN